MKQQFGLLGYPLGHSFSRAFFTDKFAREDIDAEYLNFELPDIAALPDLLAEHPALRGFNVTIPYKQAVMPFLDDLSDEARAIGAVNTVKVIGQSVSSQSAIPQQRPNSKSPYHPILKGYNTDVIGFRDSLRPLLRPHHTRALVLGTGGASKAVCRALDTLGIHWRYVTRNAAPPVIPPSSGCPLGSSSSTPLGSSSGSVLGGFPAEKSPLTYSDLTPDLIADYTLIINCTPLGMYPRIDAAPEIPYTALTSRHLLFDLVYNPEITMFMRQGRRFGATVKNGLEMLHLQALASWRIWNNLS